MQEPHRNAGGISQWRLLPAVTLAAKTATSSMPVNFVTRADPMASVLGINRPDGEGFGRSIFNPGRQPVLANRLICLTKI